MSLNEKFKTVFYCRVDHITGIRMIDEPATPIRTIPGYEKGIDFKSKIQQTSIKICVLTRYN